MAELPLPPTMSVETKNVKLKTKNGGFIALISAVIISAVLLAVTLSLNMGSFFTRFNILDSQFKKESKILAQSCLDIAILKQKQNSSYAGGETMKQSIGSCAICPIVKSGGTLLFVARAKVENSFTNLKLSADQNDLSTVSFEEIPVYAGSDCPL